MKLDDIYESYKKKKITLNELKDKIIEYSYFWVAKDPKIDAGEFSILFIPKVENLIYGYNKELASFSHYINRHIKWLMFRFIKAYVKDKENEEAYSIHQISEYKDSLCVAEKSTEYNVTKKAANLLTIKDGKIEKDSIRKRVEIFLIKNSRNLNKDYINSMAPLINRSENWIYKAREDMENLCNSRVKNREYLKLRYNRLFLDITKDERRLTNIESEYEKEILTQKLSEKRRRKKEINQKLTNRHYGPKNEEIASYLGIPKGTVDSSLFYIKKSLESLLPS